MVPGAVNDTRKDFEHPPRNLTVHAEERKEKRRKQSKCELTGQNGGQLGLVLLP